MCDFLKQGYLYSDSAISRIRHPVEVTLLEEALAGILLLYKIKPLVSCFLFFFCTSCQNVAWTVITFVKCKSIIVKMSLSALFLQNQLIDSDQTCIATHLGEG